MSAQEETPIFLTVVLVKEIHAKAIARSGGSDGLREPGLLESAVAAPQATMLGQRLYADVIEMAAAYLFYLCRNHPFIDGNKRVALGACLVFLRLNGYKPQPDGSEWLALTLDVAASKLNRDQTTERLRTLVK